MLHLPSPGSPLMPVVQVRQFSWHFSDKHGLSDIRRTFVGNNKRINSDSLFLPSQTPLVSKVRLLRVVRKIGQQERARGEHNSVSVFKFPSNGEKNVMSSSIPAKNTKGKNISNSAKYNAGMGINSPKHLQMNDIYAVNNCKMQEKEKKRESPLTRRLGNDDIIASSESDVTLPAVLSVEGINELVARKRFLPTKHSVSSLIDSSRKRWTVCKGLISLIIIRLVMILSILGQLTKIIRYERKSIVGNSMEFGSNEKLRNVGAPFPFTIFHKWLNTVLDFQRKLWHCGAVYLLWKRNKLDTRGKKKLWSFSSKPILAKKLRNLRLGNISKETFGLRSGNVILTFMAGKRSETCLCLFSDLCASCHTQLRLLLVNLEFGNRFKVIYEYIYLYIYRLCRCMLSCKWASYPGVFVIKMYTLVYFSSKVNLLMIKSHKKNQSINLIGLAHVRKAYSGNRLFLAHNRPYWRELRPLVTPWAWCIKEGTDPWKGQKRALLSHVQVSQLPLSLLSPSFALLYFYGFIIIIVVIIFSYVYLLVKGIMTVTNKPGHKYSKSLRYKPRHINSKDTHTLSLSLSP